MTVVLLSICRATRDRVVLDLSMESRSRTEMFSVFFFSSVVDFLVILEKMDNFLLDQLWAYWWVQQWGPQYEDQEEDTGPWPKKWVKNTWSNKNLPFLFLQTRYYANSSLVLTPCWRRDKHIGKQLFSDLDRGFSCGTCLSELHHRGHWLVMLILVLIVMAMVMTTGISTQMTYFWSGDA